MIFQPNRLQQKNFAQLKNTSEYAKMVSGFSITPVCLSKYLCQSCQRRNKNQDHRRVVGGIRRSVLVSVTNIHGVYTCKSLFVGIASDD